VESALLESRYKNLVLLIEFKADSVFAYKHTVAGSVFALILAIASVCSVAGSAIFLPQKQQGPKVEVVISPFLTA